MVIHGLSPQCITGIIKLLLSNVPVKILRSQSEWQLLPRCCNNNYENAYVYQTYIEGDTAI